MELGVRFTSDVDGLITGIRFYKSSTNTGTHTGTLWSNTGTMLATATFSSETTSGWQEVKFATPVAIKANTLYVASYHTNTGHYSMDQNYFPKTFDSPPLHAPSNTNLNPNGVFRTGASGFPSDTNKKSNYWVDVVFTTP